MHEMVRRRRLRVALGGRQHRGRVRVEPAGELLEEDQVRRIGQPAVVLDGLRRQVGAVGLPARRQEMPARLHQAVEFALRDQPLRGVADRVEQGHGCFPERVKYR